MFPSRREVLHGPPSWCSKKKRKRACPRGLNHSSLLPLLPLVNNLHPPQLNRKEGHLFVLNKGYLWSSWEKKWTWTSGKRIYYGENKDSVTSSQSTSLNGLVRIVVIGASVDRAQVSFDLDFGSQLISLKAENTQTRDDWVDGNRIHSPRTSRELQNKTNNQQTKQTK